MRQQAEESAPFELDSEVLGSLPVINAFYERVGLARLLCAYVPDDDARLRLSPATALGVVIRNLVIGREPVYALGQWATGFDPALLGLAAGEAELLNDDRTGRMLARLFDADRASLLTRLVLDAIEVFGIDCSQLHNDSTSIKLAGTYAGADGHTRGTKATVKAARGHSKDFRPDLKQLVWILTITADGAVPIAYRVADGNTVDDTTHIATWDHLVAMLGRCDWLYVADCKLATRENMGHIDKAGGRFCSILPATRAEDAQFRDWVIGHDPDWTQAHRRPARRQTDPDDVYSTLEAPWPSSEGYRIIWVHSTAKADRDAEARRDKIGRGIAALDALNQRLASPKSRMKTPVVVEQAAAAALDKTNAARWIDYTVDHRTEESFRQEKRGRPGTNTRYRKTSRVHYRIGWHVDETLVNRDACSDGMFPLVSNDTKMSGAELLAAYKYQPNLEKRHAQLKGTQLVAPMFLHDPARIEGLLCCHFIAMLIQALIERTIRTAMTENKIAELSLYPEDRGCAAPTTARVLAIFAGLARHHLRDHDGNIIQTFEPELSDLQRQVLDLLDIPTSTYATTE